MNIAMFTNTYKPFTGGVPISIERLANGLRDLGHKVYIFAPSYPDQEPELDVFRFKSHKTKFLDGKAVIPYTIDSKVKEIFSQLSINMIHTHHPFICGWIASYLGKKYKIPVTYTYHTRFEEYVHNIPQLQSLGQKDESVDAISSHIKESAAKFLKEIALPNYIKYYCNQCNLVIAPTITIKNELLNKGVRTKVQTLPTGISKTFLSPNEKFALEIRNNYIENKKYLFCTVARISKEKNIDFLIDGIKELQFKIGNCFNVLIIGDGPERLKMMEKAKELGLSNQIVFIGNVPNNQLCNYYKACDLFLFSSTSETQGIVLLEAMGSRVPVVAIRASGVQDVVINEVNGLMSDNNTLNWAECIVKIISTPNLLKSMKSGAFSTALSYSTWEVATSAYLNYEEVIKSNHYIKGNLKVRKQVWGKIY